MARLTSLPSLEIIRGFKGKIDFYLWKGLPCARAWPRYRQERTTPGSKAAAALFGQILKGYGLLCAEVKAAFQEDAKDQPRTARDLYVSAVLGHLHERTPIVTPPNTYTIWSPDAPPADPSPLDDEFDDAAFDTDLWTEFDPGGFLTISEQEPGLILDVASDPGTDLCGIFQNMPPGNFSIMAKVALTALSADYSQFGLGLWNNAHDPGAGIYHWRVQHSALEQDIQLTLFSNFTTWFSHVYLKPDAVIGTHIYLRIRRIGTTYYFDWSTNGLAWRNCWSGFLAFTPDHFGPLINNEGTGIAIRGLCTFFRYTPYGVFNHILYGDRTRDVRYN